LDAAISLIVEAVAALQVRSCLIDGEAVCCDDNGVSVSHVFLSAFDLLEFDGQDLRREPFEVRKAKGTAICDLPSDTAHRTVVENGG
jgi:ATP-dependent DNA ligase